MTPAQVLNAINTANAGSPPTGLKPAVLDSGGHLVLESVDADTPIVIGGAATSTLGGTRLAVGTVDPTNLLTQHAFRPGRR